MRFNLIGVFLEKITNKIGIVGFEGMRVLKIKFMATSKNCVV